MGNNYIYVKIVTVRCFYTYQHLVYISLYSTFAEAQKIAKGLHVPFSMKLEQYFRPKIGAD